MSNLYVISGMTGMTGNELARQLLLRGDTVIGFDNFFCSSEETIADLRKSDALRFFPYDLTDVEQMRKIADLVREKRHSHEKLVYINCAAVVHTEYFYHVNATFDTNVVGMKTFLEQAIDQQADSYINCSTSEVYSMHSYREGGMREDDFLEMATAAHSQRTSYATGKLLTEFFMKDAVDEGRIRGCSIRFANVYSKNELHAKHILPHIIKSLMENGEVTLLDNSRINRRTFLHNNDSCAAVLRLADTESALDGSIYNVATEEEISIVDLVHLCADKLGISDPRIHFEGHRDSDPERRVLNTDKIRERTGWKPSITLSEGIDGIIAYRRSHPEEVGV